MTYEIKVVEGCTAFGVFVNGEGYHHGMTDRMRDLFIVDALLEIRRRLFNGKIEITDLLALLHEANYERSREPCEQCGDYVTETTYQIK